MVEGPSPLWVGPPPVLQAPTGGRLLLAWWFGWPLVAELLGVGAPHHEANPVRGRKAVSIRERLEHPALRVADADAQPSVSFYSHEPRMHPLGSHVKSRRPRRRPSRESPPPGGSKRQRWDPYSPPRKPSAERI